MNVQKVWREYGSQLKRFLVSRVSTPEDAEDLLQEIMIKTHTNLTSVKDPKKFKAWLFQIARNTIIDYYRKQGARVSERKLSEYEEWVNDSSDQSQSVRLELSKCIRPFLAELPEAYRQALEEVDLNGTSQKQLAENIGLSYSTVKSRVQRGRQILNNIFQSCCSYELDARGNVVDYEKKADCCWPANCRKRFCCRLLQVGSVEVIDRRPSTRWFGF